MVPLQGQQKPACFQSCDILQSIAFVSAEKKTALVTRRNKVDSEYDGVTSDVSCLSYRICSRVR